MAACVQPRQAEKANMSAIVCGAGCRLVDCSPMCWHSVQWGHARVPRARPSCCHIALCMLCPLRRHQGDWLPVWAVEAAHHGAHARADRQRVRWQRPRPRSQTASSTAVAARRGARIHCLALTGELSACAFAGPAASAGLDGAGRPSAPRPLGTGWCSWQRRCCATRTRRGASRCDRVGEGSVCAQMSVLGDGSASILLDAWLRW